MRGPDTAKTKLSRRLRSEMTEAEKRLWYHLRARRLAGCKFVRQEAIGPFMVDFICRQRGLDATAGDALDYLLAQPDDSLGGLFAAQVVEHLQPDYLTRFLDAAYHKLRPGSKIVLETINPACWYAFFQSYIRDITHAKPLHPETLQYLVTASGFTSVEVQWRVPLPEASRLRRPPRAAFEGRGTDKDALIALASVVENNVERLNALLAKHAAP